jgi:hypothetical protein
MKIAFCGDSFCADISPVDSPYPYLISKELDADIVCGGQPGGSLFHSYETMMHYIDDIDYIIFCVTDEFRLPNRYKTPLLCTFDNDAALPTTNKSFYISEHPLCKLNKLQYPTGKKLKKFTEAVRLYYNEIFDEEYHKVVQRGILREIDSVIKEYNKKCIFFRCYNLSFQNYTFKNAVWGNLMLFDDISCKNMTDKEIQHEIERLSKESDGRVNHMDKQNNRNMANFIIDVIKQDDFTSREIDMRGYFK